MSQPNAGAGPESEESGPETEAAANRTSKVILLLYRPLGSQEKFTCEVFQPVAGEDLRAVKRRVAEHLTTVIGKLEVSQEHEVFVGERVRARVVLE